MAEIVENVAWSNLRSGRLDRFLVIGAKFREKAHIAHRLQKAQLVDMLVNFLILVCRALRGTG